MGRLIFLFILHEYRAIPWLSPPYTAAMKHDYPDAVKRVVRIPTKRINRTFGVMNSKKALLIALIALVASVASAQRHCSLRLVLHPGEISASPVQGLPIKDIHRSNKTDSIIVKTEDKKRRTYPSAAVWGFQDSHCVIYRNAFHDFLKAEDIDASIVTYSRTTMGFRGKLIRSYYFSRRFDTPVFALDKENIHSQYKSSPELIEKLEKRFNL